MKDLIFINIQYFHYVLNTMLKFQPIRSNRIGSTLLLIRKMLLLYYILFKVCINLPTLIDYCDVHDQSKPPGLNSTFQVLLCSHSPKRDHNHPFCFDSPHISSEPCPVLSNHCALITFVTGCGIPLAACPPVNVDKHLSDRAEMF